jgi:predicted CXXCH cytochrome family protein
MKRTLVLAALALGVLASAQSALGFATIKGSKHDLGSGGPNAVYRATNTTETCIFCHTPHGSRIVSGAGTVANQLPLWNRNAPTSTDYGIYNSATMNATPTTWGGNANASASLCMSCHDGTLGVGNIIAKPGDSGGNAPTNSAILVTGLTNLGNGNTALSNDHPVNFTYNTALATADGGLWDPAGNASVALLLIGGASGINNVQCASCHDSHDPTFAPFLRQTNAGSALCLVCHKK